MRIYVKTNNGRSFRIPAPIGLVKAALGLGNFGLYIGKKYIPEEQRRYVDCIDLRKLKDGFDVLRQYKGLTLVDVKASDGTEVRIII